MTSPVIAGGAEGVAFIEAHLGHAYSDGRRRDLEMVLAGIAARRGFPPWQLPERLAQDRALLDEAISEVAVGETYFFRDPVQFNALRYQILPGLLQSSRAAPIPTPRTGPGRPWRRAAWRTPAGRRA